MSEAVAGWLVWSVALYAVIGVLFAVPFVVRGAGRIDPNAQRGTWGFRLLIVPGTVALWPLLLIRWMSGVTAPPVERTAHRAAVAAGEPRRRRGGPA